MSALIRRLYIFGEGDKARAMRQAVADLGVVVEAFLAPDWSEPEPEPPLATVARDSAGFETPPVLAAAAQAPQASSAAQAAQAPLSTQAAQTSQVAQAEPPHAAGVEGIASPAGAAPGTTRPPTSSKVLGVGAARGAAPGLGILDGVPVYPVARLPELRPLPVLLAVQRPRKAVKRLRELGALPESAPVLQDLDALFVLQRGDLAAAHPGLFAPMQNPDSRRMFRYDRGLLPNRFLALLEQGVEDLEQAYVRSGLSIGYPGWTLLYYCCLCSLRPHVYNRIVETGTNRGCSTIVLAQALADSGYRGAVQTVDLDPAVLELARQNLELAGVAPYVTLNQGDSVAFLQGLPPQEGAVSFAFLDGCHESEHVFREFAALHPHLDQESTVFFDNVDDPEGVAGALRRIVAEFGGNVVRFPNCSWNPPGQALWQRNGLGGVRPR